MILLIRSKLGTEYLSSSFGFVLPLGATPASLDVQLFSGSIRPFRTFLILLSSVAGGNGF